MIFIESQLNRTLCNLGIIYLCFVENERIALVFNFQIAQGSLQLTLIGARLRVTLQPQLRVRFQANGYFCLLHVYLCHWTFGARGKIFTNMKSSNFRAGLSLILHQGSTTNCKYGDTCPGWMIKNITNCRCPSISQFEYKLIPVFEAKNHYVFKCLYVIELQPVILLNIKTEGIESNHWVTNKDNFNFKCSCFLLVPGFTNSLVHVFRVIFGSWKVNL